MLFSNKKPFLVFPFCIVAVDILSSYLPLTDFTVLNSAHSSHVSESICVSLGFDLEDRSWNG